MLSTITNETIKSAFEMFKNNASNMHTLMEKLNYGCSPYPDEENFISVPNTENANLSAANEFFCMVEDYLKKQPLGVDKLDGSTPESLIKEAKNEFSSIVNSNGKSWQYFGIYHVNAALALAIACYFFLSNDTELFAMYNRDKWESRGDYCSSYKAAIKLNSETNGCEVYKHKCKAYSNF